MREPITEDDFDEMEWSAAGASADEHRDVAEQYLAWADSPHPDDEVTTAGLLTAAGGQLNLAGESAKAIDVLWRAHARGERGDIDPRCTIVEVLLKQKQTPEAFEVSEQIRRSRPLDAGTYLYLGELWEEQGATTRALGWFMRGIMLDEREGLPGHELAMLCQGRWRIRRGEGYEPDEYDDLALAFQEGLAERAGA